MKKSILLLILISTLFFISGCSEVDVSKLSDDDLARISDKAVVCNEPYIRVGVECCLDENQNNICDRDENIVNADKDINADNGNSVDNSDEGSIGIERLENANVFLNNKYNHEIDVTLKYTKNGEEICQDDTNYHLSIGINELPLPCALESGQSYGIDVITQNGVFVATMVVRGTSNDGSTQIEVEDSQEGFLSIERLETNNLFLNNKYNHQLNDVTLKYTKNNEEICQDDTKFTLSEGINELPISCSFESGKVIDVVVILNEGVYAATMVVRGASNNLDVGRQSQEQITPDIEVIQVYATGTDDGTIDNENDSITAVIRLGSSSASVKLSDLEIQLDTMSGSQLIEYNSRSTFDLEKYSTEYISNGGNPIEEGYIVSSDLVKLTFKYKINAPIKSGETATLRLLFKNAAAQTTELTTPLVMTQEVTYLFPYDSQSLDVGEQSQEQITPDIEVVQVYATGTDDGTIDNQNDSITIVLRLGSQSDSVNLNDLLLKFDTRSGSQIVEYNSGTSFDLDKYNVEYISNEGIAIQNGQIYNGELVQLTFMFRMDESLGEAETATIRMLTQNGAVKPVDLTTPSAMTQVTTYLYP